MNAIFLKEVSDSVLNGKLLGLTYTNVSDEDFIMEINISNKAIKSIHKSRSKLKSSLITKSEKTSWLTNVLLKITVSTFKKKFSKIISKNDLIGYSAIYSNDIKKKTELKEYMDSFLNAFSIKEYITISTVKENMNKYIEEYTKKNDLRAENVKPILIVNDLKNLSMDLVEQLNNKYKEVNIYSPTNIVKSFYNKIDKINEEYGSCISILNKKEKDFRKYNICIFIDKSRAEYSKYKFNKKTCFIDFTNKENDKYNDKYTRLEKGIKNGFYYENKIKELYEQYGKITISNAIID